MLCCAPAQLRAKPGLVGMVRRPGPVALTSRARKVHPAPGVQTPGTVQRPSRRWGPPQYPLASSHGTSRVLLRRVLRPTVRRRLARALQCRSGNTIKVKGTAASAALHHCVFTLRVDAGLSGISLLGYPSLVALCASLEPCYHVSKPLYTDVYPIVVHISLVLARRAR